MKKFTMINIVVIGITIVGLALGGCANMSDTEQRTLSGAAIGAGAGTAIGAASGSAGWGAAIGPAAGPAGPQLSALLGDQDPRVRVHAAYALGRVGSQPEAVLERLEDESRQGEWAWVASQAGRARLLAVDEDWPAAASIYLDLLAQRERFPEATLGLEKAIESLQEEGRQLLATGYPAEAASGNLSRWASRSR